MHVTRVALKFGKKKKKEKIYLVVEENEGEKLWEWLKMPVMYLNLTNTSENGREGTQLTSVLYFLCSPGFLFVLFHRPL